MAILQNILVTYGRSDDIGSAVVGVIKPPQIRLVTTHGPLGSAKSITQASTARSRREAYDVSSAAIRR